jgi:hypothetical protein
MKLFTTLEIASEIGITPQSVLKRAKRLNIEPAQRILNKYCLFNTDQKMELVFFGSKVIRVEKHPEITIIKTHSEYWIAQSLISQIPYPTKYALSLTNPPHSNVVDNSK